MSSSRETQQNKSTRRRSTTRISIDKGGLPPSEEWELDQLLEDREEEEDDTPKWKKVTLLDVMLCYVMLCYVIKVLPVWSNIMMIK